MRTAAAPALTPALTSALTYFRLEFRPSAGTRTAPAQRLLTRRRVARAPAQPRGAPAALARAGSGHLIRTMSGSVRSVLRRFLAEYGTGTSGRLKVLDAYLLYVLLTGALQFGYCLGVGTFPFNSFLSGFISAVGSFILGGECLRRFPGVPFAPAAVAKPEPPPAAPGGADARGLSWKRPDLLW